MAGSIAVTTAEVGQAATGKLTEYTIAWTSDGAGAVSGNTVTVKGGTLRQVKFVPGAGGVAPSNNYTAQLKDADGVNLLGANIGNANLSSANAAIFVPLAGDGVTSNQRPYVKPGDLQLVISGGGATKQGTVLLYFGPALA